MPEDIPIKPLRFLMSNLCEKHDLVNVVDALILACEEQQQIIVSRDIKDAGINLNKVICRLEDARLDAYDIAWH
jgi:hypothetical protein